MFIFYTIHLYICTNPGAQQVSEAVEKMSLYDRFIRDVFRHADNEHTERYAEWCQLFGEKAKNFETLSTVVPMHALRERGADGRVKPAIKKKNLDNASVLPQRFWGVTFLARQVKKGAVRLSEPQLVALKKVKKMMELEKALSRPEAKAAIAEARRRVYTFVLREIASEATGRECP